MTDNMENYAPLEVVNYDKIPRSVIKPLEVIAKKWDGIDSLKDKRSSEDFFETCTWELRQMLLEAYQAGRDSSVK